jgi:hypothetical protein
MITTGNFFQALFCHAVRIPHLPAAEGALKHRVLRCDVTRFPICSVQIGSCRGEHAAFAKVWIIGAAACTFLGFSHFTTRTSNTPA